MKTLIYGAGPIGRWIALGLHNAGKDVTLLARNQTYEMIKNNGIVIVDGLTTKKRVGKVKVTKKLDPKKLLAHFYRSMEKMSWVTRLCAKQKSLTGLSRVK